MHVLRDHMRWREELSAELVGELSVGGLPELKEKNEGVGVVQGSYSRLLRTLGSRP